MKKQKLEDVEVSLKTYKEYFFFYKFNKFLFPFSCLLFLVAEALLNFYMRLVSDYDQAK